MRFAYYDKLSPARQRTYRKSDEIAALGLPPGLLLGSQVAAIGEALRNDRRADVQAACQSLIDALTRGYHVPKVKVRVLARRPADGEGELHGLVDEIVEERRPATVLRDEGDEGPLDQLGSDQVDAATHQLVTRPGQLGNDSLARFLGQQPEEARGQWRLPSVPVPEGRPVEPVHG